MAAKQKRLILIEPHPLTFDLMIISIKEHVLSYKTLLFSTGILYDSLTQGLKIEFIQNTYHYAVDENNLETDVVVLSGGLIHSMIVDYSKQREYSYENACG